MHESSQPLPWEPHTIKRRDFLTAFVPRPQCAVLSHGSARSFFGDEKKAVVRPSGHLARANTVRVLHNGPVFTPYPCADYAPVRHRTPRSGCTSRTSASAENGHRLGLDPNGKFVRSFGEKTSAGQRRPLIESTRKATGIHLPDDTCHEPSKCQDHAHRQLFVIRVRPSTKEYENAQAPTTRPTSPSVRRFILRRRRLWLDYM